MITLNSRNFALMGAMLLPGVCWATASEDDVMYQSLYYQLDDTDKTATLVAYDEEEISEFVIPATIKVNQQTYTVTAIAEGVAEEGYFTYLEVPATIREIAETAFVSCGFSRITFLMESDFTIQDNSFEDCWCEYCSVPIGTSALYSMLPFDNLSEKHLMAGGLAYKLDAESHTAKLVPDTEREYEMPENVYSGHIVIPDYVTYRGEQYPVIAIGEYVFWRCIELCSVALPSHLKEICECAFEGCDQLEGPTLPEGLRSIGYSAFGECKRLGHITIPSSVESIDDDAFWACYFRPEDFVNLSELEGDFGATICNIDEQGLVLNRDDEDRLRVFNYVGRCPSVTIPEGVEYICSGAFQHSSDLTSVLLPSTLTSIGEWAFAYTGLRSVTLPEACDYMGEMCFYDCDQLQEIVINAPKIVLSIKSLASCDNLREFTIRKGMTLTPSVFEYSGLEHVTIEDGSISVIPENCFQCCANLEEIILPGSVKTVERLAFESCENVRRIVLAEGVTSVGNAAFTSMENLEELTLPSTLSTIYPGQYEGAFAGCLIQRSNFHNNTGKRPEDYENWGLSFYDRMQDDGLVISGTDVIKCRKRSAHVTVPEGITTIVERAFSECDNIESVELPSSLTTIGPRAFYDCSHLASLTIPASVTEIGECALYNCYMTREAFVNQSEAEDTEDDLWGLTLVDTETPEGLLIDGSTLMACRPSVTTIVMPDDVTDIDSWAFFNATALRYIIFRNDASQFKPDFLNFMPEETSVFLPRASFDSTLEAWSENEILGYCRQYVFVNEDVNEDHSLDVGDVLTLLLRTKSGVMDRDINLDGIIDDTDSHAVREGVLEWK